MPDMTPTSFAAAVVPRTGKIIKIVYYTYVFRLSQSSEVVLQS